jgi:uncharacterized protein (TIGR02444 family)
MIPTQPIDTPFWAFSLAVYGRDGVEDECLKLQELLKLDVNLLLFAAFAGAVEGAQLNGQDIAAADAVVAGWHGEIVRSLRQARRALKPSSIDAGNPLREASAALRTQVKTAELEAEKIEQAILWQWSRRQLAGRPCIDRNRALAANLNAVLEFYGLAAGEAEAAVPHLLEAATAYAHSIQ